MTMVWKIIILLIRMGSGLIMLMQGFEKLTGGFTVSGLVPVIKNNQDTPDWYKSFFANIVSQQLDLFQWFIPLGEIAIGLGLLLGILSYIASFFGAFVMLNYLLADMIFTYPLQLFFFIILLMNKETLCKLNLMHFFKRKKLRDDKHDAPRIDC
ncbi:DoxX family membrane protein [Staphylococcus sp. 17KM0847]|uniref:DoxX family membrane protein n=1 Tax=Staphylococcus sp. 17KM0847 TaxID=2583989 RepID=UPI0015DBF941|nr:DoxX family membrane protein [Staphylococcus sp. 17KM0847]QLK86579.1 DoxX family membrane protein [Staphylococcus sp. 17KM0847]